MVGGGHCLITMGVFSPQTSRRATKSRTKNGGERTKSQEELGQLTF